MSIQLSNQQFAISGCDCCLIGVSAFAALVTKNKAIIAIRFINWLFILILLLFQLSVFQIHAGDKSCLTNEVFHSQALIVLQVVFPLTSS